MDRKDYTIKLLRVIATILVVLGHSNFYSIITSVSGLGYDCTMIIFDRSKFWALSSYLVGIIYSCHMQLFFAISGYVFSLCMKKNKYKSFVSLATVKFHRLVVPYIVVTILYNIPLLICANYFSHNFRNVWLYFVGYGKNHLWYLIGLFFILLLVYTFQVFLKRVGVSGKKAVLLICALGGSLIYLLIEYRVIKVTEFLYWDRVAKYLVWFMLGMILFEMRNALIDKCFSIKWRGYGAVLSFFVWIVSYLFRTNKFSTPFTSLFGVLFFYVSCSYIEAKYRIAETNKMVDLIDKYSFDIYLYGVPLNYVILTVLVKGCGRVDLNSVQSMFLFVFRFLMQLFGGIMIGKLAENITTIIKRRNLAK